MTPTPNNNNKNQRHQYDGRGRNAPKKQEITLSRAIYLELRDRVRNLSLGFSIELEDIIRIAICSALIIVFALLQTTFFVRFAPFSAVPDLMLILTAAIAASEGEKYGAVCGLCSSFVISALGGFTGTNLLPLLYGAAGCFIGYLSMNYFSNTLAVKLVYIGSCCAGRAIITAVTALRITEATFSQVILHTVIPEFFSTAVVSPIPFLAAYLCFKRFHRSREERTAL